MLCVRRGLGILAFSLATSGAYSATLTWEDCVRETLQNNPDLAIAQKAVDSAQAQATGAYSNFFPQLSANATYTYGNSASGVATTSSGTGIITTGPTGDDQGQYSAGLTATQSLFNGFQDLAKVDEFRKNLEAAKAALTIAKSNVSLSLKNAFAELLYEQQGTALGERILAHEQANLRLVTVFFEGGQENKGNQLYQAATTEQARYQNDHYQRLLRVAKKQMATLLGRPINDDIAVTGTLDTKTPPADPDLNQLVATNANHLQAFYQERQAAAAVRLAEGNWYPSLNLNAFAGKNGTVLTPDGISTYDANRWYVGASLNFPFFPGTQTIYGVKNSVALEEQAKYTTVSTDNKLYATLKQAYENLFDSIDQVKVSLNFRDAAQARSKIATEKYNTGLMTFEDWSVIEADLVTREQNLLLNQRNALQAEATWENAQTLGAIP